MLADLTRSGLGRPEAERLGIKPLNTGSVIDLTKGAIKQPAYRIPYFDLDGKVTKYYRLRLLEDTGDGTGAFKGAKSGGQRYWQPPSTKPWLYMPPILKSTWSKIAKDTKVLIVITEGEKKAIVACLKGLPCVGIGGVWSFQSKKKQIVLIPDLEAFDWKSRDVELCFDSDVSERTDLMAALYSLARELIKRGARVSRVDLPEEE